MEPIKLFVYGTLKRGHSNNDYFMYGSEFLGEAVLNNYGLYLVNYVIPIIIPKKEARVVGEIWSVFRQNLLEIDNLEFGYNRVVENVVLNGKQTEIQVYSAKNVASVIKYGRYISDGVYRGTREHLLD
jgi:gamma-glutamylcyclotransferase (GGCT)/AIG2-like uncharacterized protein YtfP